MKKIYNYFLALAFVLALSSVNAFANFTSSEVGKSFSASEFTYNFEEDVFGYFLISGKAPKDFADIDVINLGGSGEYGAGANPPYYGMIRLKNKKKADFKLLKPTLEGKNLSFKTEAVGGISYEFVGVLTRTDFGSDLQLAQGEKVLIGTLKKLKGGKTIAESKVGFTWELGD